MNDKPLLTESPHPQHAGLDRYDTAGLVAAFVADQALAAAAVQAAAPAIGRAVDAAATRLAAGGRLLYAGAGTSGRLGVLDAVELHPTFSWPRDRAIGLLAGGPQAMFAAVEGAEDDADRGAAEMGALQPTADDVAIVVAASGTTPWAVAAAQAARKAGALTVAVVNNAGAPLATACEIAVVLETGPEVVSGSTRLKAGTAQKIALNTLSSALMVRLHKTYGNLMVDLRASNAKLKLRALRLTVASTGAAPAAAQAALDACGARVKVAIVMLRGRVDAAGAERLLDAARGSVHEALQAAGWTGDTGDAGDAGDTGHTSAKGAKDAKGAP